MFYNMFSVGLIHDDRRGHSLLHYWSRECVLSWMRFLCLLLSHPHAGRCHQPPTKHHTLRLGHVVSNKLFMLTLNLQTSALICLKYLLMLCSFSVWPAQPPWDHKVFYLPYVFFLTHPPIPLYFLNFTLHRSAVCLYLWLTFQVTVRWFSPLLLGLMIKSPWSRVSIIFSAWLKLILWKLGWAITRFIYAGETEKVKKTKWVKCPQM